MASTYELIETTTLTSSASSVTFSSITQDYRDLVLVVDFTSSGGLTSANIQLNSDTGTNYSYVLADGNGSSATSSSGGGQDRLYTTTTVQDGESGMALVQIMDYTATDKHKTVLARANSQDNARVRMLAQRWADTSSISTLEIFTTSNQFASGSSFSLYGIAS